MTFNIIKHLIVALAISFMSTGCKAQNKLDKAWWMTIELRPSQLKLNNLPVTDFNDNWIAASYLKNDRIKPHINKPDYEKFISSPFKFEMQADLNKNGKNEVYRTGIYKYKDNSEGVFVSIFENEKLIKIFSDSSHKGFSALLLHNNQLRWYRCMECGEYENLIWSGTGFYIE